LIFDASYHNATLGSAVTIVLRQSNYLIFLFNCVLIGVNAGDTVTIVVTYETDSTSMALNWLTPEQTLGGKLPYLFTQCEPIHCRSLAPL
jgi:hypothetical protein